MRSKNTPYGPVPTIAEKILGFGVLFIVGQSAWADTWLLVRHGPGGYAVTP